MKTKFILYLCLVYAAIFSCSKDESASGENTFSCTIESTPFESSGFLLTSGTFGAGFKIQAIDVLIPIGRSVALFVTKSGTGEFDLGPLQDENNGSYLSPNDLNPYETQTRNNGSGKIRVNFNDGHVVKGTFEMNVSNGSRVIQIRNGKFNVRYLP